VLNNPFNGGTHLPDITVMTPVFAESGKDLLFFVASRGHHADIGGITPGSMLQQRQPGTRSVVIDNFLLVRAGIFRETEMVELLRSGAYPARNSAQNIGRPQSPGSGKRQGQRKTDATGGRPRSEDGAATTCGSSERTPRWPCAEVIDRLQDGQFSYEMDDGSCISVTIKVDRAREKSSSIFSRCSEQVSTNLNAPRSICRAAVL